MIFHKEPKHGPVEPPDHSVGSFVGASTDGVGDERRWLVHHLVTSLTRPEAQVNVFAKHDVFLVKVADILQCLPGHDEGCSTHPVSLRDSIMGKILHQIVLCEGVIRPELSEKSVSKQSGERVWKPANAELQ